MTLINLGMPQNSDNAPQNLEASGYRLPTEARIVGAIAYYINLKKVQLQVSLSLICAYVPLTHLSE